MWRYDKDAKQCLFIFYLHLCLCLLIIPLCGTIGFLLSSWFPTFPPCFLLRIPYYIVYSHLLAINSASFTYIHSFLPFYLTFSFGIRPFTAGLSGRWFMLSRPAVFCTSILSVLFLFFISLLFLLKTKEAGSPKIWHLSTKVHIITF